MNVVLEPPGGAPRTIAVEGEVVVGREGDVCVDDPRLSRRHFALVHAGAALEVRDLGSANGTYVGGARVHVHALAPGETVVAGGTRLRLAVDPPPPGDLHAALLAELDLGKISADRFASPAFRHDVRERLARLAAGSGTAGEIAARVDAAMDAVFGLGPLEALLRDEAIDEIMVNAVDDVWIERGGKLERAPARFADEAAVRRVIDRIVAPVGRRVDEASPMVDARLPDGSRVNAVLPPVALDGPSLTIRKFRRRAYTLDELLAAGALDAAAAEILERAVRGRKNILVSGGTGAGKTTLLNLLAGFIGAGERIVTIEDAAELRLPQPHVVRLEARPPNLEGRGAVTIRDLLRNALRMRPDRIVVGECRGGEALDMLQAMNTGHDGSLSTIHANAPRDALRRLETLVLFAGADLPHAAVREQVAAAVHFVVQQTRLPDGRRCVAVIARVDGFAAGDYALAEVWRHGELEPTRRLTQEAVC